MNDIFTKNVNLLFYNNCKNILINNSSSIKVNTVLLKNYKLFLNKFFKKEFKKFKKINSIKEFIEKFHKNDFKKLNESNYNYDFYSNYTLTSNLLNENWEQKYGEHLSAEHKYIVIIMDNNKNYIKIKNQEYEKVLNSLIKNFSNFDFLLKLIPNGIQMEIENSSEVGINFNLNLRKNLRN